MIMSSILCTFHCWLNKEDKIYGACLKWGEIKKAELFYVENLNQTNDLGDLGICGKIILKCIL
jgi:hypothetical protein